MSTVAPKSKDTCFVIFSGRVYWHGGEKWGAIGKAKKFRSPLGAKDAGDKIGGHYRIFCLENGSPTIEYF